MKQREKKRNKWHNSLNREAVPYIPNKGISVNPATKRQKMSTNELSSWANSLIDPEVKKDRKRFNKIVQYLATNQKYLSWIGDKWGANGETKLDIITQILNWKFPEQKNNHFIFKPKLCTAIATSIMKEIYSLITRSTSGNYYSVIDTLEYKKDNIKKTFFGRIKFKKEGNLIFKEQFIDSLKNHPKVSITEYCKNYDPCKRFKKEKTTCKKYMNDWLKPNGGRKFEIAIAHNFQTNQNIVCKNCNCSNTIRWCGGTGAPWKDMICIKKNCNTYYEVKTKENNNAIERIIEKKELDGGSLKHFLHQKYDGKKHIIVIIDRETGKVYYDDIEIDQILPKFSKNTFAIDTRPTVTIIKIKELKRWKAADLNTRKIPDINWMNMCTKKCIEHIYKMHQRIWNCWRMFKMKRKAKFLIKLAFLLENKRKANSIFLPNGNVIFGRLV
jgi:hypothetical protein